jgi:hypothetical protein
MEYASRHGISAPSITHSSSAPGNNGSSSKSRTGTHCRKGVSASQAASASSARSSTCPSPSGTEAGNSSATGHRASSTSAPREWAANQRSRKRLQRAMAPAFSSAKAISAPSQAPARFSKRSTLEATRIGR